MPSSRIRVLNLLPEIQKEGIQYSAVVYPKKFIKKLRIFKGLQQYDIVYLQKKLPSPPETKLIKRYARKLVFDFDDAVYYRDDTHDTFESRSRFLKFKSLLKNADLVVAGNRILADYAGRLNENVSILPSAVETSSVPLKDYASMSERTNIGWIGGKGNLRHLAMLSSVFQRLAEKHGILITIVCDETIEIPGVEVNHVLWDLKTQEQEIARFDIGVMPLPVNKWTEGKCGYKALQYMAAAVPPVVSDVGVNGDIVENGREGFVVKSIAGFHDAVKTLIDNKELRKEMGFNARRKVEKHFSVEVVGKKLAGILKRTAYK